MAKPLLALALALTLVGCTAPSVASPPDSPPAAVASPVESGLVDTVLELEPPSREERSRPERTAEIDLLEEWDDRRIPPGPAERERILRACRAHPDYFERMVLNLPLREEVFAEMLPLANESDAIRVWLSEHTRHFRADLVKAARETEKGEYYDGRTSLRALVGLDWKAARPIVERLGRSPRPERRVLALGMQFEHDRSRRAELQAVVANRRGPLMPRILAVESLLAVEWPGRDAYCMSLFADPTLREPTVGHFGYAPLAEPVERDPDYWIPKLARLVGSQNRAVHDNAVACLIRFQLRDARADALRPLLPWLADQRWSSAGDRLRLIQSLEDIKLPEAVPGLIRAVETSSQQSERSYAAESLAAYADPSCLPALRAGLAKASNLDDRKRYLKALLACGGFTAAEQLEALLAAASTDPKRLERIRYSILETNAGLSPALELGSLLAEEPPAELVPAALARLPFAGLEEIVFAWDDPRVREYQLERLRSGQLSLPLVQDLLDDGPGHPALPEVIAHGGEAAGVASALAQDATPLKGQDLSTRQMLLACARYLRWELPLKPVKAALGEPALKKAALAYLTTIDTPAARELLGGETGLILGESGGTLKEFAPKWEAELREELLSDSSLTEIFALFTAGYYEAYGHFVIRVRGEQADIRWYGSPGKYRSRPLTATELAALQRFTREKGADSWPKGHEVGGHSAEYEYAHLTPRGGRRVYGYQPGGDFRKLTDMVKALGAGRTELNYDVFKTHEGRVLLDGAAGLEATALHQDQGQLYVQLAKPPQGLSPALLQGEALQRWGLGAARGGGWYVRRGDRWEKIAGAPPGRLVDDTRDEGKEWAHLNNPSWQVEAGQGWRLRVLEDGSLGLRKQGQKNRVLARGRFANPVVSPDHRWALAARAQPGAMWGEPNDLVRIALPGGALQVVPIPKADNLYCAAWLPLHKAFLVYRSEQDEGPGDYFLVDPDTLAARQVEGELGPLAEAVPLVPTGRPGEYWAAVGEPGGTQLGVYDPERFVFTKVALYPRLAFRSRHLAVVGGHLYVLDDGSLLEFKLPSASKAW